MKKLTKSLLNYYAAFNETRFRFTTKINYAWTDDYQTLDFSLFPEFSKQIVEKISLQQEIEFDIKNNDYALFLDQDEFKNVTVEKITKGYGDEYLRNCINQAKEKMSEKTIIVGNEVVKVDTSAPENIQKYTDEGIKTYAASIRKLVRNTLTDLQIKKREEILEGGTGSTVDFSFNPNLIEQQIFDSILKIFDKTKNTDHLIDQVLTNIKDATFNLKLLDIFLLIDAFRRARGSGGMYLFFHELQLKESKYPLFYIEIDISQKDQDTFTVKNIRNLLNLNVSAINACKFDKILATVPKACPLTNSIGYLKDLERFIQHTYSTHQEFLLLSKFGILTQDELPTIIPRVGFQVVASEDKKLLDYSELIGFIDEGKAKKVEDMIDVFINRNVESTADSVDKEYKNSYPKGTLQGIIGSLPLPLSSTQKKVLTALENTKNKIIAVDGPPGTGKSYLISAIVYMANHHNKSVLVTSHKKEALDVVEKILKERFQKLHPDAKPNVMRFSKEDTGLNSITNSLSSAPIAQAEKRYERVDEQSEYIEQDLNSIKKNLDDKYKDYKENSDDYEKFIKALFQLSKIEEELKSNGIDYNIQTTQEVKTPAIADLSSFGNQVETLPIAALPYSSLSKLKAFEYKYDDLISKLDKLYQSKVDYVLQQDQIVDNNTASDFKIDIQIISESVDSGSKISSIVIKNIQEVSIDKDLAKELSSYSDLSAIIKHLEDLEKISIIKRPFVKEDDELLNKISLLSSALGELARKDEKKLLASLRQINENVTSIKRDLDFLKNDYVLEIIKGYSTDDLTQAVNKIFTLKYESLLSVLAQISNKPKQDLTILDLLESTDKYIDSMSHHADLKEINDFQKEVGLEKLDIKDVYSLLSWIKKTDIDQTILDYTSEFEGLFQSVGLDYANIRSFALFTTPPESLAKAIEYTKLLEQVRSHELSITPGWKKYSQYFETVQKSFDKIGDKNLKNLKQYATEINRIKDKFSAKYRLDKGEATTLLNSFSCIISPTDLVSAYFPMEEDMIDVLVIDEASQVSIAESLSLILRAKQVIVLGDELQYGAVGAVNVSKEYSEQYFSEIINSLSEEANMIISEQDKKIMIEQVSKDISEDEDVNVGFDPTKYQSASTRHFIVTNLGIRSSTMSFAKAMANYQANLDNHFRCFPEIISYSNEYFYRPKQMALIPSRIRTKPISEVIKFLKVETKGNSGNNVNLDEIYAIKQDIETRIANGFKGTIGIITSFKDQAIRMREVLLKEMQEFHVIEKDQKLSIWFVGDVQGEERDLVYYSLVEDKKFDNGRLTSIYPATGQYADRPENLKKQRLNVGFSRAKDTIVIVHSMPVEEYHDTSLGEALKHYQNQLSSAKDDNIDIESQFGSPAEKDLYILLKATPFFTEHQDKIRIIAQFEIGKYLEAEYKKYLPKYRTDFLMTLSENGKEKALIIEYDGVEYHTKDPDSVINSDSFSRQYLEYDLERQLELESYGYGFLRINKFSLLPKEKGQTKTDILDSLLRMKLLTD